MPWLMRPAPLLGAVVLLAILGEGCGGTAEESGTTKPSPQATSESTTTSITLPKTSSTTTTVPATTTTPNPWPALGDQLAQQLACDGLAIGPAIVETAWVLQCDTSFAPETWITLFDSEDQQQRYFGYYQPSQLVYGTGWLVSNGSGLQPFSSVDDVALAVNGIVLKRTSPLTENAIGQEAPANNAAFEGDLDDALDTMEAALVAAEGGDPLAAIPLFNRVIALLPGEESGVAAIFRSGALLNRGIAYEELQANPPVQGSARWLRDEAVVSYQWLSDGYADSSNEDVHLAVTWGLTLSGLLQYQEGEYSLAVGIFDEAIHRGIESGNPEQDFYLAESMFFRAVSLADLGDIDAADAGVGELIERFEGSPNPSLQPILADAHEFQLLLDG